MTTIDDTEPPTTKPIHPTGKAAFHARPKARHVPLPPQYRHMGPKRTRWAHEDWIEKARAAIERFQPRHLSDLLAALRLSYNTSTRWAVGHGAFTLKGKLHKATKPKKGWLEATAEVPWPLNHGRLMLKHLNHPTLDAITDRRAELEAAGAGEVEALRTAVDEVVGAVARAKAAERAERRRQRYGFDPVPSHRLTEEERAARKAEVAEARREFLDANPGHRVKKPSGRIGKRAHEKRKVRARLTAAGGRKAMATAMLDANRKARWQKFAAEVYGVRDAASLPRKPPETLTDPSVAARMERALQPKKPRREKLTVTTVATTRTLTGWTWSRRE